MLPDEVRKAVEVVESHADDLTRCIGVLHAFKEMRPVEVEFSKAVDELKASTQTIRAHLPAREAEVEVLRVKCAGSLANNLCPDHRDKQSGKSCLACTIERTEKRAERAEALLRECRQMLPDYCTALTDRITAHLSENSRG